MVMNDRRYIIGLFRDMTAHLEAQEKILKSREQFRVIFEESPDAILIVSIEGIVLQINAAVTRILGYTDEDLTGNPFSRFFPPQSEFELTAWKKNLTVRGAVFEAQEFVCADGGICPVDLTATMIPWENHRAILVTLRDVRERKAAEETIRRSEQKYRLLAENVGDVIWVLNRELKMVYVSPSVERLLGYTPEEMKRMPLTEVMTESTHGRMIQMLNDSLAKAKAGGQNGGRRMEIQQLRKNQTPVWVEVITTPLRDANGNLTGILGVTRDIDDRKRAETQLQKERADLARRVSEQTADLRRANAQLARSARLKDEFLAGMSHELRTPLNAVLGMTEALQEEVYGPLTEKQVKSLKRIEESGRHLLSLINDILDLSKIEAGKFQPEMTPVRIADTCEIGLRMIRQAAHKKSITVDSIVDPDVGYIRGDERSLKQIVVNLLSNAVKFTPEGGRIDLEVAGDREEGVVRIHIIDTGIGISREDADRLFQPFVQLDGALSRKYEGTGLGLSLVSRLAEIHGGGVSVSSIPDKGSRFTVKLPWNPEDTQKERPVDASAEEPAETIPNGTDPDIRGMRILLAEDNEDNIDTVVDYLTALNYAVDVARNGADAVRHAMEAAPDLILMDIQMPEVDGLEAIRRIRDNGCAVPIIALTALAMPGDRERCLKAGADEYVSKPVNLRTLSQLIRRVTAKKEKSRTERRTG
jgi:PAS domain S-box-containing protein